MFHWPPHVLFQPLSHEGAWLGAVQSPGDGCWLAAAAACAAMRWSEYGQVRTVVSCCRAA